MPDSRDVISAQLAQRRLSTRDKALQEKLRQAPSDPWQLELSPGNIAELMSEIQRTADPKSKAVLQAELDRLRSLADNMQPLPKQASPMQLLPYNPATQAPEVIGGMGAGKQTSDTPPGAEPWWSRINPQRVPNPAPAIMYPGPTAPRG